MKSTILLFALTSMILFSAFILKDTNLNRSSTAMNEITEDQDLFNHFIESIESIKDIDKIKYSSEDEEMINLIIEGKDMNGKATFKVDIAKTDFNAKRPKCSCAANNKAYYWSGDRYVCILYCS